MVDTVSGIVIVVAEIPTNAPSPMEVRRPRSGRKVTSLSAAS